MKRLILLLACLVTMMLCCNIPTSITPVVTEPRVTEPSTQQPAVTASPTATEPSTTANVTCNELSLYLDPALASDYICDTVPESTVEMDMYPQHTDLILQNYVLADKFFEAHILVFPVAAYSALLPDYIPGRVAALQALIAGAPAPSFASSFGTSLPFLPLFNAGQVFFAKYQLVPFMSGAGIRFLTEYAQYFAPVNNYDLFYTYQALTSDGQYWISAILPVNHAMLPPNAENPPGGQTWEQFSDNYEPYIIDMVNQLNAQPDNSYFPALTALDALVASITIQP